VRTVAPAARPATAPWSAVAACASGSVAATWSESPSASAATSAASRAPSARTSATVIPRSGGGGSPVIVARRPSLATACNAVTAPPRAAFTAAATPCPPRRCVSHAGRPVGIVIVEYDTRALVAHARLARGARGRDDGRSSRDRELHGESAGHAAGTITPRSWASPSRRTSTALRRATSNSRKASRRSPARGSASVSLANAAHAALAASSASFLPRRRRSIRGVRLTSDV
jgi:hypothetical protein